MDYQHMRLFSFWYTICTLSCVEYVIGFLLLFYNLKQTQQIIVPARQNLK